MYQKFKDYALLSINALFLFIRLKKENKLPFENKRIMLGGQCDGRRENNFRRCKYNIKLKFLKFFKATLGAFHNLN